MTENPLQLFVEVRGKAHLLDEVERQAAAFAERTGQEPGCRGVTFYRVNEDSQRFIFIAEFDDQAALERHFEESWRDEASADLVELLVEPPRRFTLQRVA